MRLIGFNNKILLISRFAMWDEYQNRKDITGQYITLDDFFLAQLSPFGNFAETLRLLQVSDRFHHGNFKSR